VLALAQLRYGQQSVLVRGHPGSLFCIRPSWYEADSSAGSTAFVRRCRRILTINSSVGCEALLLEKEVETLGDSSYRFVTEAEDKPERVRRLAYYLFAYLVPYDLIYSADYLRFRLALPDESAIVARHLKAYGIDSGGGQVSCGAAVQAALAKR
jgi:hypothetical protein